MLREEESNSLHAEDGVLSGCCFHEGLAELHCHLDGSLRASTFIELYNSTSNCISKGNINSDTANIFNTEDDVHRELAFQPNWDLPRCLQSFATTLLVLQVCFHKGGKREEARKE